MFNEKAFPAQLLTGSDIPVIAGGGSQPTSPPCGWGGSFSSERIREGSWPATPHESPIRPIPAIDNGAGTKSGRDQPNRYKSGPPTSTRLTGHAGSRPRRGGRDSWVGGPEDNPRRSPPASHASHDCAVLAPLRDRLQAFHESRHDTIRYNGGFPTNARRRFDQNDYI